MTRDAIGMTFFHENRRFRLVVDEEGNAIHRSTVDFGDHQLPASMRKPSYDSKGRSDDNPISPTGLHCTVP